MDPQAAFSASFIQRTHIYVSLQINARHNSSCWEEKSELKKKKVSALNLKKNKVGVKPGGDWWGLGLPDKGTFAQTPEETVSSPVI